ncbi:TerD family protein [Nocardioides sp. NPDC051685]|uniref:TerD family protein n=1 Tax=Nocardioides sp. NPDC051685 TaxID=3364334 RepID=UPI003793C5F4
MTSKVRETLIASTWTVPLATAEPSARPRSEAVARQLDVTLISSGFKAAPELLRHVASLDQKAATELAEEIVRVAATAIGARAKHNVYFRDFPRNVPDTVEFWAGLLADALAKADTPEDIVALFAPAGGLNLLRLPGYGRYRHTYAEMVVAHDTFIPTLGDRHTLVRLGGTLDDEAHAQLLDLAARTTPPNAEDLAELAVLAEHCAEMAQPDEVPARERRAVLNAAQVSAGREPVVTTVTDVLRLAAALSGGDVTLATPTRFVSLPRRIRRLLLAALDAVVVKDRARAADVRGHAEMWKRLGERLHPHEHPHWPHAEEVFATARDPGHTPTLAARTEGALLRGELAEAVDVLATAPGTLVRAFDRLARLATTSKEQEIVIAALSEALPRAAGRLVLSLREHVANRTGTSDVRIFVNRLGHAHAATDNRDPLDPDLVARVNSMCDAEYLRRLGLGHTAVIDPEMLRVTLPTSGKARSGGFGTLPRGSRTRVDGDSLRFFMHWRQAKKTTDLDLSCLMLNGRFTDPEHVSYTRLRGDGMVHSGDLVDAPEGATEMIDANLDKVRRDVIMPQVQVYSGERFEQCAEAYFGYMQRSPEQAGLPFEPATVRMRSDLTGPGRVVLPVAFLKMADGWEALWLHLHQPGWPRFNTVEGQAALTTTQVRTIATRRYLDVAYLADLLRTAGTDVSSGTSAPAGATLITSEAPLDRPDGVRMITPANLMDLVPA